MHSSKSLLTSKSLSGPGRSPLGLTTATGLPPSGWCAIRWMPSCKQKVRRSSCGRYLSHHLNRREENWERSIATHGCSSTWFTAGRILAVFRMRLVLRTLKFERPISQIGQKRVCNTQSASLLAYLSILFSLCPLGFPLLPTSSDTLLRARDQL